MKTAGLVLDFYDDVNGKLLKESFPSAEVLPDIIKQAHILSSEERDTLRDEAYALVLVNEGKVLRKFACVDPGNTLLSALYFSQNADSLPEEAQKIAAANILSFCDDFGLKVPELEDIIKTAARAASATAVSAPDASGGGSSRKRDSFKQPIASDEANWAERTNIISVRGGADSGRVIPTASQMKTAEKVDYLDSHHKLNPGTKPKKKVAGAVGAVVGSQLGHIGDSAREKALLGAYGAMTGSAVGDLVGMGIEALAEKLNNRSKSKKKVANVVDVSALEAPIKIKKASATHTALGHYPLDSFGDVQTAVNYFEENYKSFSPAQRHEYAVKTAARAEDLGIQVPAVLGRYGSTEFADDVEAHLVNRASYAPDYKDVWNALKEKQASVSPEAFVELLSEADEEAGINWLYDGDVADPYYATYGGNKVKEANAAWSWMSPTGEYVSMGQLKRLALNGRPMVEKQFDASIASAFAKDPITIFESLPTTHKTILARLASSEHDGVLTN